MSNSTTEQTGQVKSQLNLKVSLFLNATKTKYERKNFKYNNLHRIGIEKNVNFSINDKHERQTKNINYVTLKSNGE